jgi:Holliday junction resolvase
MNSRDKGKRGELELAAFLREHGFDEARRGQQFHGGGDSPDVVGVPGWHFECKRIEAGNLYNWLDQAKRDCSPDRLPVVAHRRNGRDWVAILPLTAFMTLIAPPLKEPETW